MYWKYALTQFMICVCFPDVVNLNLKSTLRVLYNLFTNYKNSDWTLSLFTFISVEDNLHLWTLQETTQDPKVFVI